MGVSLLGDMLAITAAVLFGLAIIVLRLAVRKQKHHSAVQLLKEPLWVGSTLMGVIGLLAYMSALNYSNMSDVQPLISISILIPVVAGMAFFHEKMEVKEWVFLASLLAGVFLILI